MKQTKVLAVDNEPGFSAVLRDALAEDYDLTCFHSSEAALQHYSAIKPDILLLGIDTDGINAFELCQAIKAMDSNDQSSIVFLSQQNSLEEYLRAYEVGGDDYITKPILNAELKVKINAIERFQLDKKALIEKATQSHQETIAWMREAHKFGLVVEFLKQSFSSEDLTQLATLLFDTFEKLGLDCRVLIRTPDKTISLRGGAEKCSPIEERVLAALSPQGKIYQFKERAIFNEKHVSVLVLNMDQANEAKYCHVVDIVSVLIGGLESRVQDILYQDTVLDIIAEVNATMSTLEQQFGSQEKSTLVLMDNLLLDMSQVFSQLHLGIENEEYLLCPIEEWMAKLVQLNVNAHRTDFYFERLLRQLSFFCE